jgi:hypothetical protein
MRALSGGAYDIQTLVSLYTPDGTSA